jgi:Arc/MetJ-type ribon-helix-helix transcriptional regulator
MRTSKIVSISMPEAQVKAAEQLAKAENRTMSELMREALRRYQQERRDQIIEKYRRRSKERGLTENDVVRIIKSFRTEGRKKGNSRKA